MTEQPSATTTTYESNPFKLYKPSLEGMKLNWLKFVGLFALVLVVVALPIGLLMAFSTSTTATASSNALIFALGGLVVLGLLIPLSAAIYRLTLATAHHRPMTIKESFQDCWRVGLSLFWVQLLMGLAILGGLLLLIVPGIIFIAWFSYAPYVVLEEGLKGRAALRRSRELARHRKLDTFGAMLVSNVPGVLAIIPVLGAIIGFVLTMIMLPLFALRYLSLLQLEKAGGLKTAPRSGWNYLAIFLGLVAIGLSSPDPETPATPNSEMPTLGRPL